MLSRQALGQTVAPALSVGGMTASTSVMTTETAQRDASRGGERGDYV